MNCNAFIGCTQGPDCPCGFMESDDSTQLETRNGDSSNPGYPFELLDDKPEKPPLGGRLFILACGLVAACLVASLMVPK